MTGFFPADSVAGLLSTITVAIPSGVKAYLSQKHGSGRQPGACPIPGVTPGRKTRGPSDIYTKPGGFDTANGDFDALSPNGVSDKGGGIRVGTLDDGRTIVVRPDSTDGSPTIEIQSGRNKTKVRYVE